MVGAEKSRFVSSGDCWTKFTASKHLFMGIGRECTLAVTRDVVGGSCAAASTGIFQVHDEQRSRRADLSPEFPLCSIYYRIV